MTFNRENIRHLGNLAGLEFSSTELDGFVSDLHSIMKFLDCLETEPTDLQNNENPLEACPDKLRSDKPDCECHTVCHEIHGINGYQVVPRVIEMDDTSDCS